MKNIYTYRLIAIFVIVFMTISCDKFLEETPTGFINPQMFFQNADQADASVVACYNFLTGTYGFFRDQAYEVTTDDFDTRAGASTNDTRNYALYVGLNPSAVLNETAYNSLSQNINTFCVAIDGIESMNDFPRKNELIAEAKFIRAYTYFILVRLWGRVAVLNHQVVGTDAISIARAKDIKEVYDLILSDLQAGVQYLPGTPNLTGRATKWTAMSFLAKVNLTLGNWSEAANLAKQVIAQSPKSLLPSYTDVFKKEDNAESIFEIQYSIGDRRSNQVGNWPRGIGPNGNEKNFVGPTWGGLYIATNDLINDFEQGDVRRNLIATSVTKSNGKNVIFNADGATPNYSIKRMSQDFINGIEANNNSGYNFTVMRLAEVYLIAAEAENEANGPSNALTFINAVRNRAGLQNLQVANPSAANDKALFRAAVRKERRTELFDERCRIYDLLRWGNLVERVKEARPDAQIQAYQVLWPIPYSAFEKNPGLKGDQNPGYGE